MKKISSSKSQGLKGVVSVPGDKSISHRALMLSGIAIGESEISGLLESEDVISTANALKKLGVPIKQRGSKWTINGVGIGGFQQPNQTLDMGNAGTAARLMMGMVAAYPFATEFIGDASLSKRPMNRVIKPLEMMGVKIKSSDSGTLPLTIRGGNYVAPISYKLPVASAQVKSCVLLAGLNLPGKTEVIETIPTRDHTERMLEAFGADIEIIEKDDSNHIVIKGQKQLKAQNVIVPSDPSSAAFLIVAAIITEGSEITVTNVLMNPSRTGLFKTLKEMGANISFKNPRDASGEIIADIIASHSNLSGISVPPERAPSMIDEYPILAIAASFAEGKTTMNGIEELRVKESDRVAVMEAGLKACGVECSSAKSVFEVVGSNSPNGNAEIKTHMDHRIAMSFLVFGLNSKEAITIDDASVMETSFPGFVDLMKSVGAIIN